MRSYKQWAALNESLFPLGLSNPQNVSGLVGRFQYLDEKKKHMDAENPDEEKWDDEEASEDSDEDDGDDDDEKGDSKKGRCGEDNDSAFCSKMMKKKGMKKKMKNECDCEDGGKKKPMADDDDDDGPHGHSEEDDEDMSGDEEEMGGDDENEKGRPLGFMKKKGMKKKMKKKMKKESTAPNDFLQSFNSYVAPENQMTSEEAWWKSVAGHFSNPDQRFNDGFSEYMEDYLIDPTAQQNFIQGNSQQHSPKPGDVGYAPQQRVGWFGQQIDTGEGTEDPFVSEALQGSTGLPGNQEEEPPQSSRLRAMQTPPANLDAGSAEARMGQAGRMRGMQANPELVKALQNAILVAQKVGEHGVAQALRDIFTQQVVGVPQGGSQQAPAANQAQMPGGR